jgi:hypothetical protein
MSNEESQSIFLSSSHWIKRKIKYRFSTWGSSVQLRRKDLHIGIIKRTIVQNINDKFKQVKDQSRIDDSRILE